MSRFERPFIILIIDEDPAEGRLIQEAWAECDVVRTELRLVRNSKAAFEYITLGARPDLILLSYTNSVSGDETLRALKTDPRFSEIPILVLTGLVAPEIVSEIYQKRANCCFFKPLIGFGALVEDIAEHWLKTAALPTRAPA